MKLRWICHKEDDPGDQWGMTLGPNNAGITIGSRQVPVWVWRLWDTVNPARSRAKVKERELKL